MAEDKDKTSGAFPRAKPEDRYHGAPDQVASRSNQFDRSEEEFHPSVSEQTQREMDTGKRSVEVAEQSAREAKDRGDAAVLRTVTERGETGEQAEAKRKEAERQRETWGEVEGERNAQPVDRDPLNPDLNDPSLPSNVRQREEAKKREDEEFLTRNWGPNPPNLLKPAPYQQPGAGVRLPIPPPAEGEVASSDTKAPPEKKTSSPPPLSGTKPPPPPAK